MTALAHEIATPGPAADFGASLRAHLPVIDTERLRLRAPMLEDFDTYARIIDGPGGKFLVDGPSRESAWFDFVQMTATWLLRGHGNWAVEDRATGDLIGFVLLGFEPGDLEPELGYMFLPEAEGRGLAYEAATAAREYGFGPAGFETLVSSIDHGNDRSVRLATRLGGVRDTDTEAAHDHVVMIYRYRRADA